MKSGAQRTLLITAPYFPPKGGGLEKYAFEIASRLADQHQWRIVVVTSGEKSSNDKKEMLGNLSVYRLSYDLILSNTPFSLKWFRKISEILKSENPDLINIQMPVPGIGDVTASVAGKTPIVITYHTGTMKKGRVLPDLLIGLYEIFPLQLLLRRANLIICSSDFIRFGLLKKYIFKSATITPGVDAKIFKPSATRNHSNPTVLFVGGLGKAEQHKGLNVLIAAFSNLIEIRPQTRLVIVGDGDMRHEYEELVRKQHLEDYITFRGRLFGRDLTEAYQDSDMLVLPSLMPAESFGMVLIEAMATRKPVIGTNAGGIPRVIRNEEDGLLINHNDRQALMNSMVRLIDDSELREKFGRAGRKKVEEKYDWDKHARDYSNLLENVFGRRPWVVQVVGYYPPHLGGMEIVAKQISLNLSRRGYPVTVLTSNIGGKDVNGDADTNYIVKRLLSLEVAHTPIMWTLPLQLLLLPKNSIIHGHVSQAGLIEIAWLVSKVKGLPFIAHFHLDVEASGKLGKLLPLYKRYFLAPILRSADKVIVFSEEQLKLIEEKYSVNREKIAIIPNGVDSEFFTDATKNYTVHEPLRLLYVGRLEHQKRVERLIEAVSLLKIPAHLTIIGEGELMEELQKRVEELRLENVTFEGRKNMEELQTYYRNADIFLTASDREGMSLVALEAMASGLPIIGSNVIGTSELISDTGVLIDEPYAKGFADAIHRLVLNPKDLEMYSEKSKLKAHKYSWEKSIERFTDVYREISI